MFRQAILLVATLVSANTGPYNLTFLEGGIGLSRPLAPDTANTSWSMAGWLRPTLQQSGDVVIAAVGDPTAAACRCLLLHNGTLRIRAGDIEVSAPGPVKIGSWQSVAATYDGQSVRLYIDGQPVGSRRVTQPLPAAKPVLALAPPAGNPEQHL